MTISDSWNCYFMKRSVVIFVLSIVVAFGLWFRLSGISQNHSFWDDEAYTSSVARDIVADPKNSFGIIKTSLLGYQPLNILILAFSFKLFGASEWTARMPTVVFGTLGIIFAYLVGKKLSNDYGGLLSAFVYSFSQLNLAHATQAKPYASLETLILMIAYVMILAEEKKPKLIHHLSLLIFLTAAALMHRIAIMYWLAYGVFTVFHYRSELVKFLKKPYGIIFSIAGLLFIGFCLNGFKEIGNLFLPYTNGRIFLLFNNTTYLRDLFWRQYGFVTLPAIFGLIISLRRKKATVAGLTAWIVLILFMWNFRSYSRNVRYLMPFFGVLLVFFGVFWGQMAEKFFVKKAWMACLLVASVLYLGGYKIIRKPNVYYNPNADFYGDVQIADYKTMYAEIEKKFPDLDDIALFNDIIDTEKWYLKRYSNAYFKKKIGNTAPTINPVNKIYYYHTLSQFLAEKAKYKKGLLIVEDWESILPEEIKQYAKKNMKREMRVEGLPQAKGDNWPLEVYSWNDK